MVSAADSFECSAGAMIYLAGQVASFDIFLSSGTGYVAAEEGVTSPEPPEIRRINGREALVFTNGGPGAYERPFQSFALGWDGRRMTTLAFFGENGQRVNEDGTAIGGGGWVPVNALPEGYAPGFYAESCWPPAADGMDYIYLTSRMWREWDGGSPISRIERNGPVRFRLHISTEDEEGNRTPSVVDLQTGRFGELTEIVTGREGRHLSRCEDREVPAQVRRDMAGR